MRLLVVTAFIGGLMASGCASVDLAGQLAKTLPVPAGRENLEPAESIKTFEARTSSVRVMRFNAIRAQIKSGGAGPLPAEIVKQPLLQAFVSALDRASRIPTGELAASADDPELPSPAISATDGKKFAIALREAVNPKTNERRNQVKTASVKSFFTFMGLSGLPSSGFTAAGDIPKAQLTVFQHNWLEAGAPAPEDLAAALSQRPSRPQRSGTAGG
jgi:hypothetical protein